MHETTGAAPGKEIRPVFHWTAAALAALPALHLAPIDFDRGASLLLAPLAIALLSARRTPAAAKLAKPEAVCFAVLILVAIVSTAFSPHWAASLALLAAWLWTAAVPLALYRLKPKDEEARLLLLGIALGGLVGMILVAIKASTAAPMPFPLYGNARLMGLHLLAGALAVIPLLSLRSANRAGDVSINAVALLLWAGLFWTGGRAPILGLAAACAATIWIDAKRTRANRAGQFAALALVALTCSMLIPPLGAAAGLQGAWERSSTASSLSGASSGRVDFWRVALQHAAERPWFGHGADDYNFLRPRQDGNQPHNFLLQWFGDFGLAGLSTLVVLITRAWLRGLDRARTGAASDFVAHCGWIGITGLLVTGLLDGVFYHAIVLLPTAVFFGLLPWPANGAPLTCTQWRTTRYAIAVGLGLATITLAAHQYLFFSLIARQPDSPKAAAPRLLRAFPSTTNALWRWLEHWRQQDTDTALEWARWAQRRSNTPAIYHDFAGKVFIDRGNLDAAEAEYRAGLLVTHHTGREHFERILNLITKARAESARENQLTPQSDAGAPPPSR